MKKEKLDFNLKFSDVKEYSDSLLICSVNVMYAGHNRNRTHISKECADAMFEKAAYAPVFIEFKKDDKGEDIAGSHGGRLEIDDEGMRYVDTTIVVGCVLNEPYWIEEVDGENYYCVKVALYKEKYSQIQSIVENGVNQSMEISCMKADYKEDDVLYIEEARLEGLCMISVEPCFEASAVKQQFASAKDKFEFDYSEIVAKVKATFEVAESEEEVIEETEDSVADEEQGKDDEDFATNEEESEDTEVEDTSDEEEFADDEEKRKCESEEETEDEVETEDEIEEETEETVEEDEEEDFSKEEYQLLIIEHASLSEKFETLQSEIEELRAFKKSIEDAENKAKVDDICSQFNLDDEEIGDLREKAYSYEISQGELEDKLFSIMGRKMLKSKSFSKQEKQTNIARIKPESSHNDGAYGSLTKYMKK